MLTLALPSQGLPALPSTLAGLVPHLPIHTETAPGPPRLVSTTRASSAASLTSRSQEKGSCRRHHGQRRSSLVISESPLCSNATPHTHHQLPTSRTHQETPDSEASLLQVWYMAQEQHGLVRMWSPSPLPRPVLQSPQGDSSARGLRLAEHTQSSDRLASGLLTRGLAPKHRSDPGRLRELTGLGPAGIIFPLQAALAAPHSPARQSP